MPVSTSATDSRAEHFPHVLPSSSPSTLPSNAPTTLPSNAPTTLPSNLASNLASNLPSTLPTIRGVSTSITALLGIAPCGPVDLAIRTSSLADFERHFGAVQTGNALAMAVRDFYRNGGREAVIVRLQGDTLDQSALLHAGAQAERRGLHALDTADIVNLLCIPSGPCGLAAPMAAAAAAWCEQRRAMLLLDAPAHWDSVQAAVDGIDALGTRSHNAALFFPRLRGRDPVRAGDPVDAAACGAVAGMFARTDRQRGVWKAPAGLDATLCGASELSLSLNDTENARLGLLGINCLRSMAGVGSIVWGARTLGGKPDEAATWSYIPVRRTALYIEQSLERGLRWTEGQANDAALWARIRLAAGAFMHALFLQGAFQGRTPHEAYAVRCERCMMTAADLEAGRIVLEVGFAPIRTGQFVHVTVRLQA